MLYDDTDEGTVCQSFAVSTANDVPASVRTISGEASTFNHRTLCWTLCLTSFLVVIFYYYERLIEIWKVTVKHSCSNS